MRLIPTRKQWRDWTLPSRLAAISAYAAAIAIPAEVQPNPEIEADGMLYQGLRYHAQAYLAGKVYGSPFGIDVAFAEPLHGGSTRGHAWQQLPGVHWRREAHVPDLPTGDAHRGEDPRIHPALNSAELTNEGPAGHRPARVHPVDVDVLRTAIERTLGHRATHPVPTELPDPPGAWAPVYARTNQPETQVGPASKTRCDPPHLSTPTSGV